MGYSLEAVVGRKPVAEAFASPLPSAFVVELAQGFALVPITAEVINDLSPNDPWIGAQLAGFSDPEMPPALAAACAGASSLGALAYVEAEFFGGDGAQAAVVWERGSVALEVVDDENNPPPILDAAINRALRRLAVQRRSCQQDEFDLLGLGRVRRTEDWPRVSAPPRSEVARADLAVRTLARVTRCRRAIGRLAR